MKHILLVEDSQEIFTMVNQAISNMAELSWAKTISEARDHLKNNNFDLMLLDVELPDGNGIEFCGEIQALHPVLSIFFLTSHKELSEKVMGFSAGAEDYITKPFSSLELKARIDAKLRKNEMVQRVSDVLKWKELQINKSRQEVKVLEDKGWETVDLTALEFKLLMYFAVRANDVIARDSILNDIWGEDVHVYARSVDTHVSKLRKKLGAAAHTIQSIHGAGYKFCPTAE